MPTLTEIKDSVIQALSSFEAVEEKPAPTTPEPEAPVDVPDPEPPTSNQTATAENKVSDLEKQVAALTAQLEEAKKPKAVDSVKPPVNVQTGNVLNEDALMKMTDKEINENWNKPEFQAFIRSL